MGKKRKSCGGDYFGTKKKFEPKNFFSKPKKSDDLIQRDSKGLYFFGKEPIEALCLWHTDEEYQPMATVLAKIMTHLDLYNEYVSEEYIVNCLHKLEAEGKLEIRPTTGAKIKFGPLTDVNYEIKCTTIK